MHLILDIITLLLEYINLNFLCGIVSQCELKKEEGKEKKEVSR